MPAAMNSRTKNPLARAIEFGQSLWYDGLVAREHFERMISDDGVRGATTNPAIFEKELAESKYDAAIRELAPKMSDEEIYKTLAIRTVQDVTELFLPLYDSTKGADGFVSIEVSPFLAYDTEATVREAHELYERVGRRNVMIKIPATKEGLPAIRRVIADGISVNVTLIFSIERYREVMDAFLSGLEDRAKAAKPLCGIASVASFFVSRVDTSCDKLLAGKGNQALQGKIGVANSKLAYAAFREVFGSARWKALKDKGAALQRPLWASTGTKNPAYSDVLYVEELMGPDTVNTMPPATIDAFRDHGRPADRLEQGVEEARRQVGELQKLGIDLGAVTRELEDAGVKSFSDSFKKILQSIGAKRQ